MRLQTFLALAVVTALAGPSEAWWFWGGWRPRPRPNSVCKSPGAMRGSMRSGCRYPYEEGEKCSFTCWDGFVKESGEEERTCSSGSWSGEQLVCKYTGCDRPPYTQGTYRDGCRWPFQDGATCKYSCRPGYEKVEGSGNETISCSNTAWSGKPMECKRTSGCDDPPYPKGVRIVGGTDCFRPYEEGETCEYKCRWGWEQKSGETTTTCTAGTWAGEPLVCERGNNQWCPWWRVCKPDPPKPEEPKPEAPTTEAPETEAPKTEAPKPEAP